MTTHKTNANDSDDVAHLGEVGFSREVRVNGFDSMLTLALIAARAKLVRTTLEIASGVVSQKIDRDGHISRRGDTHVRSLRSRRLSSF
jgi:hypothetical protein